MHNKMRNSAVCSRLECKYEDIQVHIINNNCYSQCGLYTNLKLCKLYFNTKKSRLPSLVLDLVRKEMGEKLTTTWDKVSQPGRRRKIDEINLIVDYNMVRELS